MPDEFVFIEWVPRCPDEAKFRFLALKVLVKVNNYRSYAEESNAHHIYNKIPCKYIK